MARMTYAQAACTALDTAMRNDASVVVVGEDVGRGGIFGQYRGLQQSFGAQRVIDTPISEATIMGAAVGMALAGLKPVVEMRVTTCITRLCLTGLSPWPWSCPLSCWHPPGAA
jgi:pyruvate dehydrogenase E1 component beta subunit